MLDDDGETSVSMRESPSVRLAWGSEHLLFAVLTRVSVWLCASGSLYRPMMAIPFLVYKGENSYSRNTLSLLECPDALLAFGEQRTWSADCGSEMKVTRGRERGKRREGANL